MLPAVAVSSVPSKYRPIPLAFILISEPLSVTFAITLFLNKPFEYTPTPPAADETLIKELLPNVIFAALALVILRVVPFLSTTDFKSEASTPIAAELPVDIMLPL